MSSTTAISSQLDEHWEAAIEHLTAQIIDLEQSLSFSATVRNALPPRLLVSLAVPVLLFLLVWLYHQPGTRLEGVSQVPLCALLTYT